MSKIFFISLLQDIMNVARKNVLAILYGRSLKLESFEYYIVKDFFLAGNVK